SALPASLASPSFPYTTLFRSLQYALGRFGYVDVAGSSLGGGVATVSLSSYLEKVPDLASRVSLLNHDSFSTTAQVVFPNRWNWGDRKSTRLNSSHVKTSYAVL